MGAKNINFLLNSPNIDGRFLA